MNVSINVHTDRADFEKVGPGSTTYKAKPEFEARVFHAGDKTLGVTFYAKSDDDTDVTFWIGEESFDDFAVMLKSVIDVLSVEFLKRGLGDAVAQA